MLSEFEKKVLHYCDLHWLLKSTRILVALSGGGDSVALLMVLSKISKENGFMIEAAHFNHHLRGEESDRDEFFCRELCEGLGIHLTVRNLDKSVVKNRRESIETVCRSYRMEFLLKTAILRNASLIATGHTMDDQAETILQRIIRGTGPAGLAGILPVREGLWIRPLLGVTRKETREWLDENGIAYCEDSTNSDTNILRNRIRMELIPFLNERFSGGVSGSLSRLAELSLVQENYLEERTLDAFNDCVLLGNTFKILLDKLKFMAYHKMLKQRIIRYCLAMLEGRGRNTDIGEIENILDAFSSGNSGLDVTSSVRCGAGKNVLVIMKRPATCPDTVLDMNGTTVLPEGCGSIAALEYPADRDSDGIGSIIVSRHLVEKYGSLTAGRLRKGERMNPRGKEGMMKIRDLMSEASVPLVLRDSMPVVRLGDTPLWVPGLRESKRTFEGEGACVKLTYKDGLLWGRGIYPA